MAKNYFLTNNVDELNRVYREIINWFKEKKYEIESTTLERKYFIQAKKTGAIRTLLGSNLAFKVTIYWSDNYSVEREFIVETSIGKWITNIAGAGFTSLFLGGIPLFIGAANAGWALILEGELIAYLEKSLNLKKVAKIEDNTVTNPILNPPIIDIPVSNIIEKNVRGKAEQKVAEDLKRLQEDLSLGLITQAEFKHKKANLEERIDEYEADFVIEEKIAKLQKAFAEGILDTIEYELKVKEIHETTQNEIIKKREEAKKAEKIAKLKEALDDGILTEEEYRNKVAKL